MVSPVRYFISRVVLLTVGALMGAFGVSVFLLTNDIAPSGLSGLGAILNALFNVQVSLVVVLGNIPVLILAYREFHGWRFVLPTLYAVGLYALALELIPYFFGTPFVSSDMLLNAIVGGTINGLGAGLIYRAGASFGGMSTLARILRKRYNISFTTASIFTDLIILISAGLVFGWEATLYALVALFVSRTVADHVLDGSGQTYTALIISRRSSAVAAAVGKLLHHQVTMWQADDGHEGERFHLLMVTIFRPEVHGLRQLMERVDPQAFVTILNARATYSREFHDVTAHLPLGIDEVEDSVTRNVHANDLETAAVHTDGSPPVHVPFGRTRTGDDSGENRTL